MPRANRYIQPGHVYHLTARCHDTTWLLRFAVHRNEYRKRLRKNVRGAPDVSLLSYCITSNHVHLLMTARSPDAVSTFMQRLQGEFAEWFNIQKDRSGGFWEGRYHCTMIESGRHLWNCMTYIDLNMVRAGEVKHPSEWRWTAFDELMGRRTKFLVLDTKRILEVTESRDVKTFRSEYAAAIDEALSRGRLRREPQWTEAIGVGSKEFVTTIADRIRRRLNLYIGETTDGAWMVREPEVPYAADPHVTGADPTARAQSRRPARRTRRRGGRSSA